MLLYGYEEQEEALKTLLKRRKESIMNKTIRADIISELKRSGRKSVREMIADMASKYGVTKQKIAGNISYMAVREGSIRIFRNRPNSEMYI